MHGGRQGIARPELTEIIGAVEHAGSVQDAVVLVRDGLGLSHATYHMAASRAWPTDAPFVRSTYPAHWISHYVLRGYVGVDPVVRAGFSANRPFAWHELEMNAQELEFMADSHAHGLGPHGYSVPVIGRLSPRAMLTLNTHMAREAWDDFIGSAAWAFVEIAQSVHRKAVAEMGLAVPPAPLLAPRETECLLWTARGKEAKAIASILKLSEYTVRSYLRTARRKLECRTLSQAVAKAIQSGMIDP